MSLFPFSREMFAKLRWALQTYRRTTKGPATAVDALDRQCGSLTWAQSRQAWAVKGEKTGLNRKREQLERARKGR